MCPVCFGERVVSVCGGFGNLPNYIIQVYIVTFKGVFSYFEQYVSSVSLSLTRARVLTHRHPYPWEML